MGAQSRRRRRRSSGYRRQRRPPRQLLERPLSKPTTFPATRAVHSQYRGRPSARLLNFTKVGTQGNTRKLISGSQNPRESPPRDGHTSSGTGTHLESRRPARQCPARQCHGTPLESLGRRGESRGIAPQRPTGIGKESPNQTGNHDGRCGRPRRAHWDFGIHEVAITISFPENHLEALLVGLREVRSRL